MTEVVGYRSAIVILHLVDSIVKINAVECIVNAGFPKGDSFHLSPARFEEEKTIFLLQGQVRGIIHK